MLSDFFAGQWRIRALRDGPSGVLSEGFAHARSDMRYAAITGRKHLRSAEHFIDWADRHGLSCSQRERGGTRSIRASPGSLPMSIRSREPDRTAQGRTDICDVTCKQTAHEGRMQVRCFKPLTTPGRFAGYQPRSEPDSGSRPSGIAGGSWETWQMAELGTHAADRGGGHGHSSPSCARAQVLPDREQVTRTGLLGQLATG
jgi:hypothetical protein